MCDDKATFMDCRTPEMKKKKNLNQLLMDETKLMHINEQVTEALRGVRKRDPEPGKINWAQELMQEQERIRMLPGEAVQNEEETESEVWEEDVEEVSDDMYAYTREDFKVTSVKRKDVANIETANESEYDTDDPDYILSEYDEEK